MLHHARGCATGFVAPVIAVPPAPTFGLGGCSRVLPAAYAASFARGFAGYLKAVLLAVLDCTQAGWGVNRKRLNITADYPKPLRLPQQSRSRLGPLRALRVRVMVCYVLRPRPSQERYSALRGSLFSASRGGGLRP